MSDANEGFLSRWARRKAGAQADPHPEVQSALAPHGEGDEGRASLDPASGSSGHPLPAGGETELPPDDLAEKLATLPKLEEIGATTDIRVFFQSWVPQALRNAALRRMWSTDPNIRDFVEVADYQMDFNVPGGAPGCGPLEPDFDVQGFVKNLFAEADGQGRYARPVEADGQVTAEAPGEADQVAEGVDGPASEAVGAPETQESAIDRPVGVEQEAPTTRPALPLELPPSPPRERRRHGAALPDFRE